MIDDLLNFQRQIDAMPPQAARIYARWDVPGVKRMWNTRGELILYCDRGIIESLPKQQAKVGDKLNVTVFELAEAAPYMGVPVVFEGPEREVWELQKSLARWIERQS